MAMVSSILATEMDVNSPVLFVVVACIILFVLAQSVFFLVRAWKRGVSLGMEKSVLKRTVVRAATFAIAPALSIFIGVVALSKKLGLPLPWLRLSIIGSLTYEMSTAESAASSLGNSLNGGTPFTAEEYVAVASVMTIGAVLMLILVPIFAKKIDGGMLKFRSKDSKWGDILTTSLFVGLISVFLGAVFRDVTTGLEGWTPVFVMLIAAAFTLLFGVLIKVTKWRWLSDFALPVSMIVAMALAIPISNAIVG